MRYEDFLDGPAWWGTCENEDCLTNVVVYRHPDAPAALGGMSEPGEWEHPFPDCYLCGYSVEWGGTDPVRDVIRNV